MSWYSFILTGDQAAYCSPGTDQCFYIHNFESSHHYSKISFIYVLDEDEERPSDVLMQSNLPKCT